MLCICGEGPTWLCMYGMLNVEDAEKRDEMTR